MSASWILVSMYLIWILESRLIRSNNQSRATLWVLETCLIVGLLPLMIILITASLSSNTYNKASWCENWTFVGTRSTLFSTLIIPWDLWPWSLTTGLSGLWGVWIVFSKTKTIRSQKSIAGIPSISIQHPKRWFRILLNCVKLKFVSYTYNWLEQMYDFRKRTMFVQKCIFESSRSPAKSESWNSPSLLSLAVLPT